MPKPSDRQGLTREARKVITEEDLVRWEKLCAYPEGDDTITYGDEDDGTWTCASCKETIYLVEGRELPLDLMCDRCAFTVLDDLRVAVPRLIAELREARKASA